MDETKKSAREKGYVTTMLGRRRNLPDLMSRNYNVRMFAERVAINTPIQGSAADIIKIAMLKIYNTFQQEGRSAKMIIQVHDELNFEVLDKELNKVKTIVKTSMEQAVDLTVPLIVEINDGANWLEAH